MALRPTLFLFFCCLFVSCQRVDRLLEDGRYAEAFELALRRAESQRRLSGQQVDELLTAYTHLQREQLTEAKTIGQGTDPGRWLELHHRYTTLHERSLTVLELVGREALRATSLPSPALLGERLARAGKRSADYLRRRAEVLLPLAREGDREAARSSHHFLNRSLGYLPGGNPSVASLLVEARDLGTTRIAIRPPAPSVLHDDYLLPNARRPLREDEWLTLHYDPTNLRIDVMAEVWLDDYTVAGPSLSQSSRQCSEEVLDYVEIKKVKKKINDTTFVEETIEIEHFKTVYATVTDYSQEMSASLLGAVLSYHPNQPDLVTEDPLRTTAGWSNCYTVCSGDARAFPPGCRRTSHFHTPPPPHQLLREAARRVYPAAEARLICRYGVCPPPTNRQKRLWARR